MLDAVEHRESFGDGVLACVGWVHMEGPAVAAANQPVRQWLRAAEPNEADHPGARFRAPPAFGARPAVFHSSSPPARASPANTDAPCRSRTPKPPWSDGSPDESNDGASHGTDATGSTRVA